MPAHRFTSSDWPVLEILIIYVTDVLKLASKMYLAIGKTWWAVIGNLTLPRSVRCHLKNLLFALVILSIALEPCSLKNASFPADIYLFKINSGNARKMWHQNDVSDVVLVSLLLTLNRFRILFQCFHCWLWTM